MSKLTITISEKIISELENLVTENKPLESCAILLGQKIETDYKVLKAIPMKNRDISQIRFSAEEDKLFEIYKKAESESLSVVGIFHSHPSLPAPSNTDKTYMEINPIPWIIKSTITGEIKCYIHDDNFGVREIKIITIKD